MRMGSRMNSTSAEDAGDNSTFQKMAAKFQDDRRHGQFGGFMPAGPASANRLETFHYNMGGLIILSKHLAEYFGC